MEKGKETEFKKPELLDNILQGTEELIKIFVTSIKTAEKKQKNSYLLFGIGCLFFYSMLGCWNNLRSEATSLFDVRRSMFDVGRSSFNMLDFNVHFFQSLLGKNNLALMAYGCDVVLFDKLFCSVAVFSID